MVPSLSTSNSPARNLAPSPDPVRPSGWGLYLVAELADRWGVDSDDRTLVWFELDRRAAAA